jgi:Kef-type K+ transport system membrane component KefB
VALTDTELIRLLVAVTLLLAAAHGLGHVFARLGQPPVVGEILGGLLLGPTLLGAIAPGAEEWLFPDDGGSSVVLGGIYQLGLLLLMFVSGAQMRALFERSAVRTVALVAAVGVIVPFAAGLATAGGFDHTPYRGTADSSAAFVLVFGAALAVTSIPVISRIMHDLDLLDTRFARIVLSVAVVEDVLLYIVLAVALGLASASAGGGVGLPSALGLDSTAALSVYHTAASVAFVALCLAAGPTVYERVLRARRNLIKRRNPVAFQLVWMLSLAAASLALGIVPMLGAFLAGIAVAAVPGARAQLAREDIAAFSFAFFVPLYFAIVGVRLDLLNHFDPAFFVVFLAFACFVKAASVYAGARIAGEGRFLSANLAVALNARGGPGIVLASVAYDAGIVGEEMFASLVMLALVTSLGAGAWLARTAVPLRLGADHAGAHPAPETS